MLKPVRLVETNHADFLEHLPFRKLPPGNLKMLWVQFGQKCSYFGCDRNQMKESMLIGIKRSVQRETQVCYILAKVQ